MKPTPSPTSPKATKKHEDEIDQLYQNSSATIEQPARRRPLASLVLLLSVIFGFMAGVLGVLVFITYGSSIPYLDKLGFFAPGDPTALVRLRSSARSAEQTAAQYENLGTNLGPSVVSIYKVKDAAASAGAVYLPSESLGQGFVLTEDGYVVTLRQVTTGDDALVVMTAAGVLYPVKSTTDDPASDLSIVKVDAERLPTVALAGNDSLVVSEQVLVLQYTAPRVDPIVITAPVAAVDTALMFTTGDLVQSSERYPIGLVLQPATGQLPDSTVVFTQDELAVGLTQRQGEQTVVVPFVNLIPSLSSAISDDGIERPFFGVRYLDLAHADNLPASFRLDQSAGAIIYSPDEKQSPSVLAKSPAQKAGLKAGDVITAIDGAALDAEHSLAALILGRRVGDTVTVSLVRKSEQKEIKVTLEPTP